MALENLEPATRIEAILDGEEIAPATRLEYFLAKAAEGGGGASDFIITVTVDDGECIADKTFAQIKAAYLAGDRIIVKTNNQAELFQGDIFSPLYGYYDDVVFCFNSFYTVLADGAPEEVRYIDIWIHSDESVTLNEVQIWAYTS